MSTGVQIVLDFVSSLRETAGISIIHSQISKNVWQVDEPVRCLLYVKGRSKAPYRWGVTANVIKRLNCQERKWFVVLLYESSNSGYCLPSSDVLYYIDGIWPLARDGDYKPAPGNYLSGKVPFKSFNEFLNVLCTSSS